MIRTLASCAWVIVVALASTYVGATWRFGSHETKAAAPEHLQRHKTEAVSVPIIADGAVAGYVVAQFVYVVDGEALKALSTPPDAFITDEAFRKLYVDKIDFSRLEKYDLAALTRELKEKVNHRLGAEVVRDILVEQFTYVPQADMPH